MNDLAKEANGLTALILQSIHRLQHIKQIEPGLQVSVCVGEVGSILNGYREGDLTFEQTKELLRPK